MNLHAAIDLSKGSAVRLIQGDFDRVSHYGDPLALADDFLRRGARHLHVVDLDAARSGERSNAPAIEAIASLARRSGATVEVGGGVRRLKDARILIDAGIDRVVVGTAAVADRDSLLEMVDGLPSHIAVGLDYRTASDGRREVSLKGWLQGSGLDLFEALAALENIEIACVIVTAIDKDGTFEGPDVATIAALLDSTRHRLIASGGVGTVDHIAVLARLRSERGKSVDGAVVGKALVDGRIGIEEAIAACEPSE